MAKGYWIARVDVHNMDGYKEYVAQNGAVFINTAQSSWCAAAGSSARKARGDRAMWYWNSKIMKQRWPATTRRNTHASSRFAVPMPRATS